MCWVLVPETFKGLWRQRARWAKGGVQVLMKNLNLWYKWRYRRLWPIFVDYVIGILWAYSFAFLVLTWVLLTTYHSCCELHVVQKYCYPVITLREQLFLPDNPLYPVFHGAVLGVACLMEFFTSFCIDLRYERQKILQILLLDHLVSLCLLDDTSAMTAIAGSYSALLRQSSESNIWKSPDRGLHNLKS